MSYFCNNIIYQLITRWTILLQINYFNSLQNTFWCLKIYFCKLTVFCHTCIYILSFKIYFLAFTPIFCSNIIICEKKLRQFKCYFLIPPRFRQTIIYNMHVHEKILRIHVCSYMRYMHIWNFNIHTNWINMLALLSFSTLACFVLLIFILNIQRVYDMMAVCAWCM